MYNTSNLLAWINDKGVPHMGNIYTQGEVWRKEANSEVFAAGRVKVKQQAKSSLETWIYCVIAG